MGMGSRPRRAERIEGEVRRCGAVAGAGRHLQILSLALRRYLLRMHLCACCPPRPQTAPPCRTGPLRRSPAHGGRGRRAPRRQRRSLQPLPGRRLDLQGAHRARRRGRALTRGTPLRPQPGPRSEDARADPVEHRGADREDRGVRVHLERDVRARGPEIARQLRAGRASQRPCAGFRASTRAETADRPQPPRTSTGARPCPSRDKRNSAMRRPASSLPRRFQWPS